MPWAVVHTTRMWARSTTRVHPSQGCAPRCDDLSAVEELAALSRACEDITASTRFFANLEPSATDPRGDLRITTLYHGAVAAQPHAASTDEGVSCYTPPIVLRCALPPVLDHHVTFFKVLQRLPCGSQRGALLDIASANVGVCIRCDTRAGFAGCSALRAATTHGGRCMRLCVTLLTRGCMCSAKLPTTTQVHGRSSTAWRKPARRAHSHARRRATRRLLCTRAVRSGLEGSAAGRKAATRPQFCESASCRRLDDLADTSSEYTGGCGVVPQRRARCSAALLDHDGRNSAAAPRVCGCRRRAGAA